MSVAWYSVAWCGFRKYFSYTITINIINIIMLLFILVLFNHSLTFSYVHYGEQPLCGWVYGSNISGFVLFCCLSSYIVGTLPCAFPPLQQLAVQ